MAKFLITGATGYIGGDALFALLEKHPEVEANITCLVRNSDRGAVVAKSYPKINLIYGSLDDSELLEKAASEADIVCHFADCDHEPSATAITAGLVTRISKGLPAFLIHTSGTGILTYEDVRASRYGQHADTPVYDDWTGISTVTRLPDDAWHRKVDKIVLASAAQGVKTAIVAPPTISGEGRGPGNGRSIQWYGMAKAILEGGRGFQVGEGGNEWTFVDVVDLSDVYLEIMQAALEIVEGKGEGKASWGEDGYYFAEAGGYRWGDIAKLITKEAKKQGYIESDEVHSVGKDEAEKLMDGGSAQWGLNSKCKAIRANKLFGWRPRGKTTVGEFIPTMVENEALALGLAKTHAQKAAGL